MASSTPSSPLVFTFGPFELNPTICTLRKSGITLKLQPQPLRILLLLIERQGEVVTRAEIQRHLWGNSTFVDFERGINFSINQIRAVLCDDATTPRYIETIPRVGYRFMAPVSRNGRVETSRITSESPVSGQLGEIHNSAKPGRLRRSLSFGAMLLIACILLIPALAYLTKPWWPDKQTRLPVQIVGVTSSPGSEIQPSFSPDANQMVFTSNASGTSYDIYVKEIGEEKMLRLTQPPGSSFCPKWSPDGKTVAYERRIETSRGGDDRSFFLMTPLGGAKRLIGHAFSDHGCGVSWSPDETLLAYDDQPPGENAGIFVMSLNGDPVKRLTTSTSGAFDRFPAFSPDGRQIAFSRGKDNGKTDIYLFSMTRHEEKKLASLDQVVSSLTWTPDGKRIIFALGYLLIGHAHLFSVTTDGGELERLQIVSSEAGDPVVSRRGGRLAYVVPVFDTNIWKYSIEDNTPPSRLIASTKVEHQPSFSADGRRLAFVSNRDGEFLIWISNADGTDPVRASALPGGTPVWSPDGTQIAFNTNDGRRANIVAVGADGGKENFLTDNSDGSYVNADASWSIDGNSVYFNSNRTGAWEIWKTSVRDKKLTQITRHGGCYAQESPDGQFIYFQKQLTNAPYFAEPTPEIWRMPARGGREELIVRISDPDPAAPLQAWWFWRVTKKGIYFIDNPATPKPLLRFMSLPTRKTRTLRQLDKEAWGGPGLAVSPDEKVVLVGQVDEQGSDIMMVENFR